MEDSRLTQAEGPCLSCEYEGMATPQPHGVTLHIAHMQSAHYGG